MKKKNDKNISGENSLDDKELVKKNKIVIKDFKKIKPKTIIFIITVIIILVFVVFGIMGYLNYSDGNKAFENKNYLKAISKYEKISWLGDVKKRLNNAYVAYGNEFMNNDDCNNALIFFKKTNLGENDKNVKYCNMYNLYYDDFEKAEKYYEEGKLSHSLELYNKIDSSFTYHDVSVADRLRTLGEYERFVNLTGTKNGTGKTNVSHIWKRNGSWEGWDSDFDSTLEIKCIIQDDGTIKIILNASFLTFTNYSSLQSALKADTVTAYFNSVVNKDEEIPASFDSFPAVVANSGALGYASLTYSNGESTLNYLLDDVNYSQYFSNKYTSTITYR